MITFLWPKEYVFVLMAILLNCQFTNLIPWIWGLPARKRTFNKEFLTLFHGQHRRAYPESDQLWGNGILPHENKEIISE